MANRELVDYITRTLKEGYSEEQVRERLLLSGWKLEDIHAGFRESGEEKPELAPPRISIPPSLRSAPPREINLRPFAATPELRKVISPEAQDRKAPAQITLGGGVLKPVAEGREVMPRRNRRRVLFILLALLVLGGGGAFAYARNYWPFSIVSREKIAGTPSREVVPPADSSKMAGALEVPSGWLTYTDEENGFRFSYPPGFGSYSTGTGSGFGNRVAAIKFSDFSWPGKESVVLGGEVVLTRGRVSADIQALGGLYDPITSSALGKDLEETVLAQLPPLTVSNFCEELAKTQHLDLTEPAFDSLNTSVRKAIEDVDRMRNDDPKVIRCDTVGNTITFYKEVTAVFGQFSNRQHIYGAISFIEPPYSSFQIIRASAEAPTEEALNVIATVVQSLKVLNQ
ncbi:MAG: hypothetical protein HY435_03390 [Candidatus Liptonbacteria bacterium]|nr:hypothetical protein [Candidatus Liptonbacteria bacterium]